MAQASPKTENYVIIKILIPVYCAGACIGKDGLEIQRIKSESGSRVKVSRNRDLFPRTDERVVLVSGTPDQVIKGCSEAFATYKFRLQFRSVC